LAEQDFDSVLLVQPGGSQSAIVESAALTERDHLLSDRPGGFGFGQGRGDAVVFDQAAHQIGEHGIAMLTGAAEFGSAF
jgi:hypothetical protein